MTDLQTRANDINEVLKANRIPLTAMAGKRAIKWFKRYAFGQGEAYGVGKTDAANVLRYYGLKHLAA